MANLTVACKLPQGIHLDHAGKRVTLNGTNSSLIIGGHGLTPVDKEWFDSWLSAHKDFEPVKQGLIFAHGKEANVKAEAQEKATNKSGFEGIDPRNPGKGIEPAEAK